MTPKYRIILASFVVSTLLMIVKFVAYYMTYSSAILTDALESIINVVASGFAFYAIYLASQPKDLNHPYGHGKIEFFSAGLEGVLIVLASIFIIFHAVQNFFNPQPLSDLPLGLGIIISGVIINWFLGYYIEKEGIKYQSPTLIADGKHLKLDAQSGIILIAAVALVVFTESAWVDGVASVIFAVYMGWSGIKIMRKSIGGLMDETDQETLEKVVQILKNNKKSEWIDIHNLRIQHYGADLHIDCHITLPRYYNLEVVHANVHEFEDILGAEFQGNVEIFIHADPCLDDCCYYCKVQDCPIRKFPVSKTIEWNEVNLSLNQKHFIESI